MYLSKEFPQWPKKIYAECQIYGKLYSPPYCVSGQCGSARVILSRCHTLFPSLCSQHDTPAMQLAWRHKDRMERERAKETAWHSNLASPLISESKVLRPSFNGDAGWTAQSHTKQNDNVKLFRSSSTAWLARSKHFSRSPQPWILQNLENPANQFLRAHKQASLRVLPWPCRKTDCTSRWRV